MDSFISQVQKLIKLRTIESFALGSSLDLDELSRASRHDIHIYVRARILFIGEIEQCISLDKTNRHRA